jgi:SAM-dependent methyltransferase
MQRSSRFNGWPWLLSAAAVAAMSGTLVWAQPKPPGGPPPQAGATGAPPTLPSAPPGGPAPPPALATIKIEVPVNSSMSLVHVGSSDSFAITAEGRQAATLLMTALEEKDVEKSRKAAREASDVYSQIIPRENYGGEYTALQWFADYLLADTSEKAKFLEDPQVRVFFGEYGGNDYAVLKEYLIRKYRIREIADEDTRAGQERKIWLEDTILFNNPRRETWEKTSEFMKLVKLNPGDKVADIGSGPGYFTFRFAQKVAPGGEVFAIDTVAEHLKYVERAKAAMGVMNVKTVETDGKSVGLAGLEGKLDAIWLCSLYHNIYAMTTQPEPDALVDSIKEALKEDGKLYLVDNGLVEPGILPYHGPYVAKELLIGQLLNYGFNLVEQHQPIPQRYMLVFQKAKVENGVRVQ